MVIYDEAERAWKLGEQIASGGEGTVYRLTDSADYCVKIYHKLPLPSDRREKLEALRAMPQAARRHAAIPLSLAGTVKNGADRHSVIMPMVGGRDIFELYHPECRISSFGTVTFEFLLAAARNLVVAFEQLHTEEIIVGDVNERNIKVRSDATLTFIDCDSFQFRQRGRLFTSDVGTPIWTPPELQGRNLHGLERTQNHDLFGMAQLVFLLLFGGRYPFAGKPVADIPLSPEVAIKRFAFAYDPAPEERLLSPPHGATPFETIPPTLRELFLRSFRKGSEAPSGRPLPEEWSAALGSFSKNLVQCSVRRSHVYWSGAIQCPWCLLLKVSQLDLFPGPAQAGAKPAQDSQEHLKLATRLLDVAFLPLSLIEPAQAVLEACVQQAKASSKGKTPWYAPISVFGINLERFRKELEQLKCELDTVLRRTRWLQGEADNLPGQYRYAADIAEVSSRNIAARLRDTGGRRFAALQELQGEWKEQELGKYLKRYSVINIALPKFGENRRQTLISNGILTAAEIREASLLRLPGFGAGMVSKLMNWRRECEIGFRFDATAPLPVVFMQRLNETIARRVSELIREGTEVESGFTALMAEYRGKFGVLQSEYEELCERRAVLEWKVSAIEKRRR